jgi:acetoacetate decarboxylase
MGAGIVNDTLKRAILERVECEEVLRRTAVRLVEAEEAAEENPGDATLGAGIDELRRRYTEAERAWAEAHRRRIEFAAEEIGFEKPPLWPRMLVERIPRADGEGYDVDQVVLSQVRDATTSESRRGWARVELGGSTADPVSELGVGEVLGAEFVVGDFVPDHGRVLEERALGP